MDTLGAVMTLLQMEVVQKITSPEVAQYGTRVPFGLVDTTKKATMQQHYVTCLAHPGARLKQT